MNQPTILPAAQTQNDSELPCLLSNFQTHLEHQNMSPNTIRAYCFAVRQFLNLYPEATHEYMMLYKCYLIEHYKPQTVNLRIRAMNCYLEFLNRPTGKLLMVRMQHKSFLENVISQADYEYFKNCLIRDGQYKYYFAVRFMADTGMRISELVTVTVDDVKCGYINLCSKGNRIRRVYIPRIVRIPCLKWLEHEQRSCGYVFLNRYGHPITTTGIRDQLKQLAIQYSLDPMVVYPHTFRHLFAKNFIERCDDIAMLSDILGHESIETTRIYLHRSSLEQQQIFNQVVNW